MASKPGILTDWPWTPLGNFKYIVLVPWVGESVYSFFTKGEEERDLGNFLIFPFTLWRMLHNQAWISLSRYRTAKGNNRIVDKPIEFDQVDRERNWDDQIIFNALLFYAFNKWLPQGARVPLWRTDGVVLTALLHIGPVEFLYYWLHRALHHHFLYCRYHSHHHSSIATEPITSVIHPFAEHIAYFVLFAIALLTPTLKGVSSIAAMAGYITYIDFMNNMGHCNFELVPKWVFRVFPPLKHLMYTPSFHSLHHTQFRTNYSLFMPFYDYIYGTMDKSSDSLYENSLQRQEESPDVVHLTHLTTPESIFHLRLGFASLASKPYSSSWYLWLMWPVTFLSTMLTWAYGRTFVVERNRFDQLRLQRHPHLKVKLVDGSSLAAAVVLNSIPQGTTQVLIRGNLTKVAYAVAFALCQKGTQISTLHRDDEYEKLKKSFGTNSGNNLVISSSCATKIWLVGDELGEEEQAKAAKGTVFIPFSQFPPKKLRKDCFYRTTPAMSTPQSLENVDSCENWLPRRVMSAWRVAGLIHALEGWKEHECGFSMENVEKIWKASLRHGFRPLKMQS